MPGAVHSWRRAVDRVRVAARVTADFAVRYTVHAHGICNSPTEISTDTDVF
jgi:hypothetical protein